ncbi:hypothetical protein CJF42_05010 [Pseudoalteromonas sp. NBT06-2]|nr:hypothetical protein CJF42_05010 [Pseudoalteromonas sp. NBT06-2]
MLQFPFNKMERRDYASMKHLKVGLKMIYATLLILTRERTFPAINVLPYETLGRKKLRCDDSSSGNNHELQIMPYAHILPKL